MKRTKEDALVTKQQIVENAVELFIQKGFSDATLEEIAVRTGVTRGAIYWHFKNKLDVMKELIETQHRKVDTLLQGLFAVDAAPFQKIQNVTIGIVGHFYGTESFRKFIELTWFKIEYTRLSTLKTTKTEHNDYFISNLSRLVVKAREGGEVKKFVNESDVALTITNMINGMYRTYFILPEQGTREKALSTFAAYLELIKA